MCTYIEKDESRLVLTRLVLRKVTTEKSQSKPKIRETYVVCRIRSFSISSRARGRMRGTLLVHGGGHR
jgi:hypothetical protein